MEAVLGRSSGHGGLVVKKEETLKRSDSEFSGHSDDEDRKEKFTLKIGNGRANTEISDDDTKRSSPKPRDQISNKQIAKRTDVERSSIEADHSKGNDELESTKAEMDAVREENERLKMYLTRITKDYKILQMRFNSVHQEATKTSDKELEEPELVSLSLGSFSGATAKIKDEKRKSPSTYNREKEAKNTQVDHDNQEGLSLGLDCKYISEVSNKSGATDQGEPAGSNPSAASSLEKEEAGETWPPSKALKPVAKRSCEQDEVSQAQNPVKKARVCVRARCDTPTMNDGCQWRKYGQKIAKGNPCPRAYYRCTVAPLCPVRKQVQRFSDDMSILITTYEGTHNHPLPVSATAMASTTSAAASMLLSGSSTSSSSSIAGRSSLSAADGFNTFETSKWNQNKAAQFYLPNASNTYSSFSSSHPTITLDLTSTPPNSSTFLNKFSHPSSSSSSPSSMSLYPSTSLSFGSSESSNAANIMNSLSWSSDNGFLSYGSSSQQAYNLKNQMGIGLGRQTTSLLQNPSSSYVQNYMQLKMSPNPNPNPNPNLSSGTATQALPDSSALEAATKAITENPAFKSALAAALTSIIGGGRGQAEKFLPAEVVQSLKWSSSGVGDHHQVQFPASTTTSTIDALTAATKGNITGCATTFMNKTTGPATSSQPAGSLMFLSPNSLSFSASKSASSSPGDTRDQTST